MFRNLQAEVEQTVADRIDTLGGNDVVSLFQSSQSLIGKFHDLVLIACGSRTVYLHSVDIEYGIIIIGEFQIDRYAGQIAVDIYRTAHPDIAGSPLGLGCRLIFFGTKGTTVRLPSGIIVIGRCPVASGLGCDIPSSPLPLLRGGHDCIHLQFFSPHKTVGNTVYLHHANQREILTRPMANGAVIKVIAHGPCTGIRVDGNKRVGWSSQVILDDFIRRILVTARKKA